MAHTKREGVATAIGLGAGTMTVAAIGLLSSGLLLNLQANLLGVLKIISGSYIAWIGVRLWINSNKSFNSSKSENDPRFGKTIISSFFSGLVVNLFNPKVILLFLSLFTTILLPTTPISARIIILALVTLNATLWYSVVAIFLSNPKVQQSYCRFKKYLDRVFGTVLFSGGFYLIFQLCTAV